MKLILILVPIIKTKALKHALYINTQVALTTGVISSEERD